MDDQSDEYIVPLLDQRYFGAGIRKQKVQFVAASDEGSTTTDAGPAEAGLTAAEQYKAIVFGHETPLAISTSQDESSHVAPDSVDGAEGQTAMPPVICEKCLLPLDDESRHASSLAHQVCLAHVHPPSALDRKRKGLTIMQSAGWDPDSRLGLGSMGEGRLYPIRSEQKQDRLGIGHTKDPVQLTQKVVRTQKLDAGRIQKMQPTLKKRTAELNRMFYANDDVAKYLGEG